MENKKNEKQGEIDEQYLMSMMAGQDADPKINEQAQDGLAKPKIPAKRGDKSHDNDDYEKIFFKNAESMARTGKSVYIRPEFHERLSRIVQVIGEDKLTIYSYLDNVLEHHFREFGEQIVVTFNNKYKPIL